MHKRRRSSLATPLSPTMLSTSPPSALTSQDSSTSTPTPPPAGFWSTTMPTDGLLRRVVKFELYAVLAGLAIALLYAHFILFRLHLPVLPRLFLLLTCPFYHPFLLAVNAAFYCVLSSARGNLRSCEAALSRVMDAVTAPVLIALPAGSISLDDLRSRFLRSGDALKKTEADARTAESGGRSSLSHSPLAIASRLLLDAAVRAVLYVLEKRYANVFRERGSREISSQSVKRALTGEVVGMLVSPFSATLQGYTLLVIGETLGLALAPFVVTWLVGGRGGSIANSK